MVNRDDLELQLTKTSKSCITNNLTVDWGLVEGHNGIVVSATTVVGDVAVHVFGLGRLPTFNLGISSVSMMLRAASERDVGEYLLVNDVDQRVTDVVYDVINYARTVSVDIFGI